MSKRVKYIFLGLLIVCVCSLSLNFCQAFSTKSIPVMVHENLKELEKAGKISEGKELLKALSDTIPSAYKMEIKEKQ